MTSTYNLQMRKHTGLCQPQINTARECQARTFCEHTNTLSASNQPSKKYVKYVLSANVRKHTGLCQPQINSARNMSSTYKLRMHKHTRFCQPQIKPAMKMSNTYILRMRKNTGLCQPRIYQEKRQARTSCERANTRDSVGLKSTQQGNVKHVQATNAHTHTQDSVSSDQPSNCETHTVCEHTNSMRLFNKYRNI